MKDDLRVMLMGGLVGVILTLPIAVCKTIEITNNSGFNYLATKLSSALPSVRHGGCLLGSGLRDILPVVTGVVAAACIGATIAWFLYSRLCNETTRKLISGHLYAALVSVCAVSLAAFSFMLFGNDDYSFSFIGLTFVSLLISALPAGAICAGAFFGSVGRHRTR